MPHFQSYSSHACIIRCYKIKHGSPYQSLQTLQREVPRSSKLQYKRNVSDSFRAPSVLTTNQQYPVNMRLWWWGILLLRVFAKKTHKHPDSGRTQSVTFEVSMLQAIAFIQDRGKPWHYFVPGAHDKQHRAVEVISALSNATNQSIKLKRDEDYDTKMATETV